MKRWAVLSRHIVVKGQLYFEGDEFETTDDFEPSRFMKLELLEHTATLKKGPVSAKKKGRRVADSDPY